MKGVFTSGRQDGEDDWLWSMKEKLLPFFRDNRGVSIVNLALYANANPNLDTKIA